MPTDKTPRASSEETAALPATESAADETTVLPVASADETTVLPVEDAAPVADTVALAETTVLPVEDAAPVADTVALAETTGPSVAETAVLPLDETRPLPAAEPGSIDEPVPTEPPAYTSPIGALYAPTDRPEPAPTPTPTDAFFATYAEPDRVEPVVPVEPVVLAPVDPPRRRLRVGTVVWGLVLAAIGVGLLAWAAGVAIDLQLAMIVLLAVAGTALLVGSIVSGARNARR